MNNNLRLLAWLLIFPLSISIAATAAWFSITGLAVLFSAATIPVMIMATLLETGKLATAFILHRFWRDLARAIKWPLTFMVFILMFVTSIGIFGFLSKGHLDQEIPVSNMGFEINRTETNISALMERREELQREVNQYNESIDNWIRLDFITRAQKFKIENKDRIDLIKSEIKDIRQEVKELEQNKIDELQEQAGIEAKLGPVQYFTELVGFDSTTTEGRGTAVRWMIVLIMLSFDPLAILLILTFDTLLKRASEFKRLQKIVDKDGIASLTHDELKDFDIDEYRRRFPPREQQRKKNHQDV